MVAQWSWLVDRRRWRVLALWCCALICLVAVLLQNGPLAGRNPIDGGAVRAAALHETVRERAGEDVAVMPILAPRQADRDEPRMRIHANDALPVLDGDQAPDASETIFDLWMDGIQALIDRMPFARVFMDEVRALVRVLDGSSAP